MKNIRGYSTVVSGVNGVNGVSGIRLKTLLKRFERDKNTVELWEAENGWYAIIFRQDNTVSAEYFAKYRSALKKYWWITRKLIQPQPGSPP